MDCVDARRREVKEQGDLNLDLNLPINCIR